MGPEIVDHFTRAETLLLLGTTIAVCAVIAWALFNRVAKRMEDFHRDREAAFQTFVSAHDRRERDRESAFNQFVAQYASGNLASAEQGGALKERVRSLEAAVREVRDDVKRLLTRSSAD